MYLSLIVAAIVVLPAPVMIRAIGKKRLPYRAVLEGILAAAAGAMLIMAIASASKTSIFNMIMDDVRGMAQILAGDPSIAQAIGPELTESERFDLFVQFYEQAARLFPASICVLAAFAAYMEYILLSNVIRRMPGRENVLPMDKLRNFSLPKNAGICWLGMLLLSWLAVKTDITGTDLLYVNINALFNFVFCLQGISVLFMYIYKKGAPKAIAVIITAFFLFSGIGKLALMILGFADLFFGLKEKLH